MIRILFVCLGNICRSPTAEGVMSALVKRAGIEDEVVLDSAGTAAWHVGAPPDPRAAAAARARGIELSGRARQVVQADFLRFDLIVAMDDSNRRELRRLAPDERAASKIKRLLEYDRLAIDGEDDGLDVPDPYDGTDDGFEHVIDLIEAACGGLLVALQGGGIPLSDAP